MKNYTSIEQAKKLAEFLPLESADMIYVHTVEFEGDEHYDIDLSNYHTLFSDDIPAWSLAALLELIPKIYYPVKDHPTYFILGKPKDKWCALYWDATGMQDGEQTLEDNPVDACVEMILKLHELNLL